MPAFLSLSISVGFAGASVKQSMQPFDGFAVKTNKIPLHMSTDESNMALSGERSGSSLDRLRFLRAVLILFYLFF